MLLNFTVNCFACLKTHLAIDDRRWKVEFLNHANWDGSAARFGIVHLSLEEYAFDVGVSG
jgi:hypothetical protein